MSYGLYISAAGLQVSEYRQSVIANNLANSHTVGFKRDLTAVIARQNAVDEDPSLSVYRVPAFATQSGGTLAYPNKIDLSQATLHSTINPLDVALDGKGFFTVQGEDQKSTLLTRDGRFQLDSNGQLINHDGRPVLDDKGHTITLDPTNYVAIDSTGQIKQAGITVATLGVSTAKDPNQLQKLGNNLLTVSDPATLTPSTALVRQGYLEDSGVDPSIELVNMLENQRIFDANTKMIQGQDKMTQALNQVGRVA